MVSRENSVVLGAALATVAGLVTLGIIKMVIGFPGDWAVVVAFFWFFGVGYVLPQVYLLRVDETTSRVSRMGIITLLLLLLGPSFAASASGIERFVILASIGLALAGIVFQELRDGYNESMTPL